MTRKLFLAHRAHTPQAELEAVRVGVLAAAKRTVPDAEVVLGADDFARNFAERCNRNWTVWAADVVARRGFDQKPVYFAVVVPFDGDTDGAVLGKATADIVRNALEAKRVVRLWSPAGGLQPVTMFEVLDPECYAAGWRLR